MKHGNIATWMLDDFEIGCYLYFCYGEKKEKS